MENWAHAEIIAEQVEGWIDNPGLVQGNPAARIYAMANYAGRFRFHAKQYDKAVQLFEYAFNASLTEVPEGDVCTALQMGTALDPFPQSIEDADASLAYLTEHQTSFLGRKNQLVDDEWLAKAVPSADRDPYNHCMLTLFTLSFYYRADTASVANNEYRMAISAWPNLKKRAPHVKEYMKEEREYRAAGISRPCVKRKIRLGIVSGVMSEAHSVTEDFSGVQQRLNRDLFDVTYIYIFEKGDENIASYTKAHKIDKQFVLRKTVEDEGNGAWTVRLGKFIAKMKLDMLLYLDLTMSTFVRRTGMMRLAPVQLNSHGHPVTSGIDSIDYFVSWAEAELAQEVAQKHYTEKLLLIPNGTLHQYYEPRTVGDISRMDGKRFKYIDRDDFDLPDDVSLYLCMQKPFKMHPEFDHLVCGILQADTSGHAVLHREDSEHNYNLFQERLAAAGCDLNRVHFVPVQPHHRLMALYSEATVILDSYPAGGCTTTREVLELGKAVVTLPARLLGGRWTLAYLNVMGLSDNVKRRLVASSEQEYVQLAVSLGTNSTLRRKVERAIRKAFPRLLHRDEAVHAWEKILLDASPVQICEKGVSDEL